MRYVKVEDVLTGECEGESVRIRGWVYRRRKTGGAAFVVIRDSTGILQCVAERERGEIYSTAKKVRIESSVEVSGTVRREPKAPGGYEVLLDEMRVVHMAEPFPINRYKSEEYLLDNRHLWLRSRDMTAVMKIRSTVFGAIHEFFRENGYYEVQAPMFVGSAVEGGSTLFEVPYFDKKAYLTQSSQFYLEAFIYSLERVYTVAPSFRAEKSRTRRHLTEFWHAEAEVAWYGNEDMMKDEELMIEHIVRRVLADRRSELEHLGRDLERLRAVEAPFERMRYEKLIEMARDMGVDISYGDDLGADEERAITREFEKPVFVTHYPSETKPFYHRPDPENPSVVLCHDLLAPEGYGEIIGGGERIWKLDVLLERIRSYGLNPDDYGMYIDLRRYGSVPHAGFGLGVDRAVMWIAGLDHINKAIAFPRTIRRLRP